MVVSLILVLIDLISAGRLKAFQTALYMNKTLRGYFIPIVND